MLDLLITGGGPAGLALSIAASLRGLRVRVLDRASPPRDKACGEGLMPSGLEQLARWGVQLPADAGHPFRGILYQDPRCAARAAFPAGQGLGLRRLRLHEALHRRAAELGVELCWKTEVRELEPGRLLTSEGWQEARWLVAADGLHSPLRKLAGLSLGPGPRQRFGLRQHFKLRPWSPYVEVFWSPDAEAYVTPVSHSEIGVAFLWGGSKARWPGLLERFPALAERLQGAVSCSRPQGAGPLHQRVRSVCSPRHRLALMGDAAGYLDAITGEGLSLAFHQAESLSLLLQEGRLEDWPQQHRAIARKPYAMIHLLLWLRRSPWLRRRAIAALGHSPELFSALLGLNDGTHAWSTLLRPAPLLRALPGLLTGRSPLELPQLGSEVSGMRESAG